MNKNNKQKNYIFLKYSPYGYEIFIISDSKKIKLKENDAEIMRKTLNNFKAIQIGEDAYIYPDVYLIILAFKRNQNKKNRKRVNRKKSSNISLCIVLSASLAVGGFFVYNHYKNKTLPKTNTEEETDDKKIEKINVTIDDETIEVSIPTEIVQISEENDIKNVETYEIDAIEQINTAEKTTDLIEETEVTMYEVNQVVQLNYYEGNPGDLGALENAKTYDEIFLKYEKRYGIDINLLRALAAQESSGRQDATNGYAVGVMGIENTWTNDEIKVYNFETGEYEKIIVDYEKAIKDADYNIMIRAANFQEGFYTVVNSNLLPDDEILAYTLQRDNMGATRMQNVLKSGMHWMEGRKLEKRGDPEYFENVLSRLDNGTTIKIKLPDGTYFSTIITNLALEKTYSKN